MVVVFPLHILYFVSIYVLIHSHIQTELNVITCFICVQCSIFNVYCHQTGDSHTVFHQAPTGIKTKRLNVYRFINPDGKEQKRKSNSKNDKQKMQQQQKID